VSAYPSRPAVPSAYALRLLCAVSIGLLAGGCDQPTAGAVGPHSERFFAAVNPAARECVRSAMPVDHLEDALASMTLLPRRESTLPHDLDQLATCTGAVELRKGIARVVLASLPEKRSRLMLEQEDTPSDAREISRRFAEFPERLGDRNRSQGFERRGPARISVAYQRGEIAETPQVLMVDLLDLPGPHPPGWTAGEMVAIAALDARENLIAAGVYHGVAWARFSDAADDSTVQVITWGDVDGRLLFRAEGASREVLAELLRAFRTSGMM